MEKTLSNCKIQLKETSAGDVFDAIDEAKTVHTDVNGVSSFILDPFKLDRTLILKSVASITKDGASVEPSMEWLRGLNSIDLKTLENEVEKMDQAMLKELGNRGRDSAAS